jgi:alkylated DNA nucleotide flippase Atl1
VPVLIPCHRVVRSDGHIGEYALGGSDNKRAILAAEGVGPQDIQRLAQRWRGTRAVS